MLVHTFTTQGRGSGIDFEVEVAGKTILGYEIGGWTRFRPTTAYLRIVKDGIRYRGYYSEDGADWMPVGVYDHERLTDIKIGISATNDSNTDKPEIPADFDYFCVAKLP